MLSSVGSTVFGERKTGFCGADVLAWLCHMAKVCFLAIEPFNDINAYPPPGFTLNEAGEYCWGKSDLPARLSLQAGMSATSRWFALPPRAVMFLVRKIMGAYTWMAVLDAELAGHEILQPYCG